MGLECELHTEVWTPKAANVPAAIQPAVFEMNLVPPRAALAGDCGTTQAFHDRLHREMDSGNSPAATQPGASSAETGMAGNPLTPLTPREVASPPRNKRVDKTSDPVTLAMAVAPIPVEPQLPTLLAAGSTSSAKPERSTAPEPRVDHADPMQAAEPARAFLASNAVKQDSVQVPLPSPAQAAEPGADAKPVERKTPAHNLPEISIAERPTPTREAVPAAPQSVAPQPKAAERLTEVELPQLSLFQSLAPANPHVPDNMRRALPVPLAAGPTRSPVPAVQDHAGKSSPVTAEIKLVAGESARVFSAANVRALSIHLQAGPSPRPLQRGDPTQSVHVPGQERESKVDAGGQQNTSASGTRSRGPEAQPAEKTPPEKPLPEKTPAKAKDPVPTDAPSLALAPHIDAPSAKPVIAAAAGTQSSGGVIPSGQAASVPGNPQTAGTVAKTDSLHSADANPAPPSADVVPVHTARFMQSGNDTEMRLGLRTESFGTVQVHTTVSEKQVELALGSERGDLRGLIANDLPNLQTSLQQHDLRLHEVRTLEQASPERNAADHSPGHSPGSERQHPRGGGHDFLQDDARPSGEPKENNVPAGNRGLSIRA